MSQLPTKTRRRKSVALAVPASPTDQAAQFMALLERAASDPAVDVGKMRELLDLKREVITEQRHAAFNRDFMAARQEMPRITKDGAVAYPVDKNKPEGPKKEAFKFARYETIDAAIRPIEEIYGFSRSFTTSQRVGDGGGIIVRCNLLHREGHSIAAEIPVPLDSSGGKNNLQGYGSSFSYGKRYTTTMIWDLVTEGEDDDGMGAFQQQPIDEVQFQAFQNLIDENEVDVQRFCAHLKIGSLSEITNKMYPKAMADLKDGIRKRKEAAAKAAGAQQ